MSAWLKAGLIGAAILIVLNLIGLVPLLGCVTLPLTFLAYIVIGVLAAAFMPPVRTAGGGAGQGAVAALLAGFLSGIINLLVAAARAAMVDTAEIISQIPPEILAQLKDAGLPTEFFVGMGGAMIFGSICCVFGTMIAIMLGAIGGAIYAAVKPE